MNDVGVLKHQQLNALRTLCQDLIPTNAFYAQTLKDSGLDLGKMTLEQFSERFPFTTRQAWTADQLAHPPFGTNLTYSLDRYVRFNRTSGSTSRPMIWLDTRESWEVLLDCWARVFRTAGVTGSQRIFFAFSFGPFLGFWTAYDAAMKLGHMCIPAGGLSSEARLRLLQDTQAEVLCCTPTYAIRLARVAQQEGIDMAAMNVHRIVVAGEPGGSIPATRKHISQLWQGARVFDHHGMTEVGPVTYECPSEPGVLHVMEDTYYPEVVDEELVLTTLRRTGSPLLRYKTGDAVRGERRLPCACGSVELSLLGGILGRKDDMAIIRGVNVFPSVIEELVHATAGIEEYQVALSSNDGLAEMKVTIEAPQGQSVCRELAGRIQRALFLRVPVELAPAGSLPRYEMKARRWTKQADYRGFGT